MERTQSPLKKKKKNEKRKLMMMMKKMRVKMVEEVCTVQVGDQI